MPVKVCNPSLKQRDEGWTPIPGRQERFPLTQRIYSLPQTEGEAQKQERALPAPTIPLTANYGTEDKDKVISFASSFGINHSAPGLNHRTWPALPKQPKGSASGTPNLRAPSGFSFPTELDPTPTSNSTAQCLLPSLYKSRWSGTHILL